MYESNIRGYQLIDGIVASNFGVIQVEKSLNPNWKGKGVGLESSM
jgi:hypothetical protein